MFLLIAIIVAVLGASLIFFFSELDSKEKVISFIILTLSYSLIAWWIFYAVLPSFAWPLLGLYGVILAICWVITCIVGGCIVGGGFPDEWNHIFWLPIVYMIILPGVSIFNSSMFRSSDYANLIGNVQEKTEKHWSQDVQPLDPTHIRLVPKEQALSLAMTTLSKDGATLGSQFPLSTEHITLQKINNDYWYLIPLDFKSWTIWTNANYVPAYVKVSATDPYAKPLLITGKKIKYTPGAYFWDNLERRLFDKYKSKILMDYSFEEDEQGNVFWIVSVCKPTIGFGGLVLEGIVIFNPETGEDQFVSMTELNKDAKWNWIDRVVPAELVEEYINYWGDLKNGWWNSFWSHINLLKSETPTMNYSADSRCVFVSPITSSSDKDQAMTGLMYTDAKTGKFTYYMTSGGATEQAVIDAVNSTVSYQKWHANSQIVYENVYGKLSALVPILGENGNYQGLAIVENENKRVAVGTTPQDALIKFQELLMNSGGQMTTDNVKDLAEFTGKIVRLGWDISGNKKQYYIYLSEFKNSFVLSSSLQSELALTREGDVVFVQYIKSEQTAVPVVKFKNISLSLKSSQNQKNVAKQISARQKTEQIKADVKDFKANLNDMPDAEVQKLMEKQKK